MLQDKAPALGATRRPGGPGVIGTLSCACTGRHCGHLSKNLIAAGQFLSDLSGNWKSLVGSEKDRI